MMDKYFDAYGAKLYLQLLHGNFLHSGEAETTVFIETLSEATEAIPNEVLRAWLNGGAWRTILVAAWVIGTARKQQFEEQIARMALAKTCFAGQGLCFALAAFGSDSGVASLEQYLDKFLPAGERQYDQEWAIGALAWTDVQHKTTRASRFLQDITLWQLSFNGDYCGTLQPERGIAKMHQIVDFLVSRGVLADGPRADYK